jgi:hypothetical protein
MRPLHLHDLGGGPPGGIGIPSLREQLLPGVRESVFQMEQGRTFGNSLRSK